MKPFSQEWISALAEKLKNDGDFQEKAEGFDSRFQFSILQDPKANVKEAFACGINLPQSDETWFERKADNEVDIILEGKYSDLVDVVKGKARLEIYLTAGKLRLKKGNIGKLLSYLGGVNRFVEVAKIIST